MFGCMLTSLGYRQPQLCLAVGLPPSGIALFIFGCMFTLSGIDSLSFVWLQTYLPREQIPFALFGAVFGCRFTPFGYRQHQLCLAVDLPRLCFVWSCVWLQVYPCRVQIAFALFGCRLTSPLLCLELFGCRFTHVEYRQHSLYLAVDLPPLCFVWSCVWLQVYPFRVQIALAVFCSSFTSLIYRK